MNKTDNLALLDRCMGKLRNATPKDIEKLEEIYLKHSSDLLISKNFKFLSPSPFDGNVDFKRITIDEDQYNVVNKKCEINYLLDKNEKSSQESDGLAVAA